MNDKLTIWLADLFHDQVSVLDVVPLNLGYLASAARHHHASDIEVRLFKYPGDLIGALDRKPPDVLALSNYTWNARLSLHVARLAKRRDPSILTVMGGPNIRLDPPAIRSFLTGYPYVDAYIPLQAETPFATLVGRLVESGGGAAVTELYRRGGEIPGCFVAAEGYAFRFVESTQDDPFRAYPSPYQQGILDAFIADERLVPLFETNRGCPYRCTFCAWGIAAQSHLRKRPMVDVLADFRYVAEHGAGQDWWFFADANFGIVKRDLEIAAALRRIKDEHGFPKRLNVNWAKGSNKRMLAIMEMLRDMAPSQIAVQSFDTEVLHRVQRRNLSREIIEELIEENHRQGCSISTDLLVGCSGESFESHVETLRTSLRLGFDTLNINNIRMLPGTQIETEADRREYGLVTKFRFIPNSYGRYGDTFVYEVEEAIKATDAMAEAEMNRLKRVHFLIYLLWNAGFGRHLLTLAGHGGMNPLDVLLRLDSQAESRFCGEVLEPLAAEYASEWFETAEALDHHFSAPAVYENILSGKTPFEKLTWKYVARCLGDEKLLHGVLEETGRIVKQEATVSEGLVDIVTAISRDRLKLDVRDASTLTKSIQYGASHDLLTELKTLGIAPDSAALDDHAFTLRYVFSKEDYDVLNRIVGRHDYDAHTITALCAALSNGMVGSFTYSIQGNRSAPTGLTQRY